ncbi:substrate-binding periplasmic protein [Kordiimonas lacus]|uniref:Extracellular solute-binding protein, family 3 n=1 Tax=Kordiimonas lacus TaxID=637679 RepID=A0A1G7C2F9_9PROT|nr:transporter substrate-binding domain-containing protein [Kordiimonas lacus]SDE33511.1 extracellular solute-binding protein, family 3 [Kordiimonas lacus]
MGRWYKPLVMLMALLAPSGAWAQPAPEPWMEGRPVLVGTITHNPPYVFENPSAGIDLDLVTEAFAHVGLEVEFVHAPLSRVQVLLATGKVDAMTTFRTIEDLCVNSIPFSYWHDGISVPVESEAPISSIEDLKGMRVGMFPGAVKVLKYLTPEDVMTFGSSMIVYDREQLVRVLLYRRLDAYIGDYWALEYAYQQLASDQPRPYKVAVRFAPTPRQLCVRDEALVKRFNEGVATMLAGDAPARVRARYLQDGEP